MTEADETAKADDPATQKLKPAKRKVRLFQRLAVRRYLHEKREATGLPRGIVPMVKPLPGKTNFDQTMQTHILRIKQGEN